MPPWSQGTVWSRSQRTAGRPHPGAVHRALRARAGRRVGAESRAAGGDQVGRPGRRVTARYAAVGAGGTVGVQGGDAPPGAGVASRGGGQVAGVVGVYEAEPVGVAGGVGAALVGGQGDGDGDQGGQARPGRRTGTGSGTVRAALAARAARSAGTVRAGTGRAGRVAVRWRLVGGAGRGTGGEDAAVAFLQQIEVGADPQVL